MKINLQNYFNINALGLSNLLWNIPLFAWALYLKSEHIATRHYICALIRIAI